MEQTTDPRAGLRPETQALLAQVDAGMPSQQTPEFTRLTETLLYIRVCTSLSDFEAHVRANAVPSGTSHGWQLCTDEGRTPVPCDDHPDTHRHLMFEC